MTDPMATLQQTRVHRFGPNSDTSFFLKQTSILSVLIMEGTISYC
jgi:hypothetical protein